MRVLHLIFSVAVLMLLMACSPSEEPVQSGMEGSTFALGADISWVTEMEKDGQKFFNSAGKEMECISLMKEIGFNAIRLRVWVNPADGWCNKEDVLTKARRAQRLGMRLMIDFHYSDFFADPGRQTVPSAWEGYDAVQMGAAVSSHTGDVLQTLKNNGINVAWVQVGNEVNQGMLWPSGKVNGDKAGTFVSYLNEGYCAVKRIYPDAQVILHVSNGHDAELFRWFFTLMQSFRASYDMIGMSLYPIWWENGGWCSWKSNVDKCVANIRSLQATIGKPVMICETGMPVNEPQMSAEALKYVLDQMSGLEACRGVFYWEPQTDGVWKPARYDELGWGPYDMGAFKDGRPTAVLDAFKITSEQK